MEVISDRKKENILIQCVANNSDPNKLKKSLYANDYYRSDKLDVTGLENLKQKLTNGSKFGVKS